MESLKTYLVFTLEDCLITSGIEPVEPIAAVKAFSKTGAKAAVYLAVKEGYLDPINIEECRFLEVDRYKELISHEVYENTRERVPIGG